MRTEVVTTKTVNTVVRSLLDLLPQARVYIPVEYSEGMTDDEGAVLFLRKNLQLLPCKTKGGERVLGLVDGEWTTLRVPQNWEAQLEVTDNY